MKNLTFAMAFILSAAIYAEQCNGLTKEGERCKREAAADSKYCIGHADQGKNEKPKDEKAQTLEDDGTCWAITQKETRCKNKKDGESDYCRVHAVKKVEKTPEQCRAFTYSGTQCSRKPVEGYNYCAQHCGKTAAKTGDPVKK